MDCSVGLITDFLALFLCALSLSSPLNIHLSLFLSQPTFFFSSIEERKKIIFFLAINLRHTFMSMDISTPECVCYVHCNFCNTILAVSVPCSTMYNLVTVRCGHCATLLSVNLGPSPPSVSPQSFQLLRQHHDSEDVNKVSSTGSSSSTAADQLDDQQLRSPHIRPPEKRQRVPSAYNKFIKEEIQRIKASNPEISHREAFSAAAKNWAHFPHIHFSLNLDGQKQTRLEDQTVAGEGTNKSCGFY